MIGIIIQLFVSWLLLKLLQKENLNALGLLPTADRVKAFGFGLLFPALYFSILFGAMAYAVKNPYQLNPGYSANDLFKSAWYLFKSVAFETLIFHGALLYILIKRIGTNKAIFISTIAFGIYHWFSWNLFGNYMAMATVFLTTGILGFTWALAFAKTRSVYLPFALHYGVNFTLSILFSKDKSIGHQLFVATYEKDPYNPGIVISIIFVFLYFVGFPLLSFSPSEH